MTQFYSRVDATLNGDVYSIPFSYTKEEEIHVYINNEIFTNWYFLNESQIKLNEIPADIPNDAIISIRRVTDISEKAVDYTNNTMLAEEALNLSQDQLLYAVQEIYDNNIQFEIDTLKAIQENKEEVLDTVQENKEEVLGIQQAFEDEVNHKIQEVSEAASKINALEEAVDTAVTAANTATEQASIATDTTQEIITASEELKDAMDKTVEEINDKITNFDTSLEEKTVELTREADRQINKIQSTGFYMRDDKLYFINSKGEEEEFKSGGAGAVMFDTKIADHILTGEEALGWALQGTYVNKSDYPSFYEKCLEEYQNSTLKLNVDIVGSLTNDNGVLSGFSLDNYGVMPNYPTNVKSFEIQFKFNTPSVLDAEVTILGQVSTNRSTPQFGLSKNGEVYFLASSDGTAWDAGISAKVNPNQTYIANVKWDGATVTGTVEDEAGNITNMGLYSTYSNTLTLLNWVKLTKIGCDAGSNPFTSSIDLKESYIKINGSYFWLGAGLTVKNPNGHEFYLISNKPKVDEIYNACGIADFYGIDEENERIFLPRNKYFQQLTDDISKVNDMVKAGLPNIEAKFNQYRFPLSGGAITYANGVQADSINGGSAAFHKYESTFNASKSNSIYGNSDTVQPPSSLKLLYYCVGNTEVTQAITNVTEITTSENDTIPLFTGMYFDFKPNNASWLKAGVQQNSAGIYKTCYDELVKAINGINPYDLKVINVADKLADVDYSEYWILDQDNLTFRTPLVISTKSLSGGVMGNGMTLGLTNGSQNLGLIPQEGGTRLAFSGAYGTSVGISTTAGAANWNKALGVTSDPTKSGIIAEESAAQLYFKVANAVRNLELLDAGEVLEGLANVVPDNSSLIASYAMPSSKYIDLEVGANGAEYTAPANGWFALRVTGLTGSTSMIRLQNNTNGICSYCTSPSTGNATAGASIPVLQGDVVTLGLFGTYNSVQVLRFVYAQGEV